MHILNDFFYCHSIISGYICLWAWNTTRFRGVLRHLPVLWRQRQPNPHARRDMRPRWVLLRIRRLPLWTPCELPHLLHKGPHRVIISQFPAHIFFFLQYNRIWLNIFSQNSDMIDKTYFSLSISSCYPSKWVVDQNLPQGVRQHDHLRQLLRLLLRPWLPLRTLECRQTMSLGWNFEMAIY